MAIPNQYQASGLNLYEPEYEHLFGVTLPGSFGVGGGGGRLTPEEQKALYERDVQQTALENMRRIQAQNPQFQGIGSIVSAPTGAREPLAFGQQTAPAQGPAGRFFADIGPTPEGTISQGGDAQRIQEWWQANQGKASPEELDKFLVRSGFSAKQISSALPQFSEADLTKAIAGATERVNPSDISAIRNWWESNQGKASEQDLQNFLVTSGYSAAQINQALPQFRISDLNEAMNAAVHEVNQRNADARREAYLNAQLGRPGPTTAPPEYRANVSAIPQSEIDEARKRMYERDPEVAAFLDWRRGQYGLSNSNALLPENPNFNPYELPDQAFKEIKDMQEGAKKRGVAEWLDPNWREKQAQKRAETEAFWERQREADRKAGLVTGPVGQRTAPQAPVGGFRTTQQTAPKAPVGELRTEQQKAPTGTIQERATTFGNTFKSLTSDPTKTEYDVKKYLDTIRQDKDLMKAYGNKLDPYFAYYDKVPEYKGDATDYLTKQLQNQQGAGTAQYWKSGLDTDTATKYMADTMRKYGLKDINQLGVKEVEVPASKQTAYTGEDGGTYEYDVPASTKKVFYNKATGEEISGPDMDANTGQFGKTYEGKGNTAFRVQFNKETGKPVFYTTQHSSSDLGTIAPMLAMASLIPGVAPFAQGINALIAAKQGNPLGAVLSGLGAAGGIGKLMGASSDVLSGIKTARDAVGVANAIKNKDIFGLVSSGANLGGFDLGGMKIAGDITAKDALSGLGAARALQNKDYASLLNYAAQMSKSDNLQTAAKGIMIANAIKSKNPTKIAQVLASMAGSKKDDTPPPKGAGGGLLQGPSFVTVPDNAAADPRVFSGIAGPLLARSM